MSKKAKTQASERRKKDKRNRKAAEQAKYAAWAADGKNHKSKRSVLNNRRNGTGRTGRHEMAYCGNHGCRKCHPEYATHVKVASGNLALVVSKADGKRKLQLFDLMQLLS